MSNGIERSPLGAPLQAGGGQGSSWFEAMADAWGQALDSQAQNIEDKSAEVSANGDKPADVTELTAMSLKMSFLASSSHTAISSVGSALETMARKQ
jgi:hypothetical protein